MKIIHIVGARPNFMKVAPVIRAFQNFDDDNQILVHTGQHYDENMSAIFFRQLDVPEPDVNLEVGSGSHAIQTAEIMVKLEDYILKQQPDWVFVYGDVNSTLAATLVCAKMMVKLVHVEAGLRSFDRTMPEEVNRLVTDRLADLLLTPSEDGNQHLIEEGISPNKIHCVGNVMIDTLIHLLPKTKKPQLNIQDKFILVTLHRPSNVDDESSLKSILETFKKLPKELQIIFPMHPRTRSKLLEMGYNLKINNMLICEPLGYLEFLFLQKNAMAIVTDSGGIQEESTWLGIPCLTMRENTERPITVDIGTNTLIGKDMKLLIDKLNEVIEGRYKKGERPKLWDGHAGQRIADLIHRLNYEKN